MSKIELNHFQIKALLDLSEVSGDPEGYDELELRVVEGNSAHSGPGLYATYPEVPENGWMFIGKDEDDQARADAICDEGIKSGRVQEV